MPLVTFYFQLHQPLRLHPERDKFLWDEKNREIFIKVSEKCYLPATNMFTELVSSHPEFKITLSMSGTFLEQAQLYQPAVIRALQELYAAGMENNQVEFLDETYYHSLTSLFKDPGKQEFRDQVSLHREKMRILFGVFPTSFRNTELMYNNHIADVVADMGYAAILCERREDMYTGSDHPISPNAVFRSRGNNLIVIPRNRELSDDVAFRFPNDPITPDQYAAYIARIDGEAVLLGYDYEHIGEHIWEDKGIFDFWRGLPESLSKHSNIVISNPSEIAERFKDADCPVLNIHGLATSSWADAGRDTFGWLGNLTQYELFKDIESLEKDARRSGMELFTQWRHLTTSDHIYFLHERIGEDHAVHAYFNPYGGSIAQPTHVLTRKIDDLESHIRRFEIIKEQKRTAVLMITPETGRLPEDMGALARYISGKSGGQGEVISALCEGLSERGIEVHLVTLNLKKRFQREMQLSEHQWREIRYNIDPEKIHLVSSAIFADNLSAYAGDPLLTAAEFQKEIVNNIIKEVRGRHEGRLIIHSHDWMAGGAITAYARSTGIPVLHTVHNVFTADLPLEYLGGIDINKISENLYISDYHGKMAVDCQATAIKNATIINFVGKKFLMEVVEDYFHDRPIVPISVRNEVKAKYYNDMAWAIMNAPSSNMYPERCEFCIRKYGPDDPVIDAKKENLVEFQKRTGLNIDSNAILFFWPSRLDPSQKGVELLEAVAWHFVNSHHDAQIAIVADGIGNDRKHAETLGRIACASNGRIAYHPYSDDLCMLGYAAASDVFGASIYEPCGQIDQVGNLFGATATNRDTGGFHDKIRELRLKRDGATQDVGNGFLFRDYDTGGLWYGLGKSLAFHRRSPKVKEKQLKRIMREAREKYDLGNMIAEYIRIYEKLNGGRPLV
ncbi:MAG: glycogen/starch synthase [Deltaproteobacteria bacterium]